MSPDDTSPMETINAVSPGLLIDAYTQNPKRAKNANVMATPNPVSTFRFVDVISITQKHSICRQVTL